MKVRVAVDFSPDEEYHYRSGHFFLGIDNMNREIGMASPRHAITIAGARSGKGACVIIPNLMRWPHNTLVIDPKGDNVKETWEQREALDSNVYVIDPFEIADVPERLKASFNPLLNIDIDSLTASADLEVIADGLVKRSDPKHAQWDDGAVTLLAGVMAFVISEAPEGRRTLKEVRDILLQSRDELYKDAQHMMQCEACDGLAQEAGAIIITSMESEKSMETDFISAAKRHIKWINLKAMRNVLEESTFDLSELKNGKASVFVILPPEYLETHSAFLRLFVRSAINAMAKGGSGKGEKCLFFLDEFFALGKIDLISKSSGLMPSYGVHLWPILQDLGQLISLYGRDESQTFFGNSDLHQFFGNTDQPTLEYISNRLGVNGLEAAPLPPSAPATVGTGMGGGIGQLSMGAKSGAGKVTGMAIGGLINMAENASAATAQAMYQDEMNQYQHAMQNVGKPRFTPDEIAKMLQRKNDVVADAILNIANGSDILQLRPAPFFRKIEPVSLPAPVNDNSELELNPTVRLVLETIISFVVLASGLTAIFALPELFTDYSVRTYSHFLTFNPTDYWRTYKEFFIIFGIFAGGLCAFVEYQHNHNDWNHVWSFIGHSIMGAVTLCLLGALIGFIIGTENDAFIEGAMFGYGVGFPIGAIYWLISKRKTQVT